MEKSNSRLNKNHAFSLYLVTAVNGTLLALAEKGYAADRLMGIDYFEGAASLASCEAFSFHRLDFLKEETP